MNLIDIFDLDKILVLENCRLLSFVLDLLINLDVPQINSEDMTAKSLIGALSNFSPYLPIVFDYMNKWFTLFGSLHKFIWLPAEATGLRIIGFEFRWG